MTNNKEQFQELYDKHSLKELAKMFNVSIPTIYRKAEEAGLKMKGKGNSKAAGRPRKSILGF